MGPAARADEFGVVGGGVADWAWTCPPGPRFGVDGTLERFIRVPYTLPEDQLPRPSNCWPAHGTASPGPTAPEPTAVVV